MWMVPSSRETPGRPLSRQFGVQANHVSVSNHLIHVFVCALAISFHTHRDLQRQSFIPAYHFSFFFPSPIHPSVHAALQSGLKLIECTQTHSVTIFNYWLQKSPLESPAHCSYRTGCTKRPRQHVHASTHTHTQAHDDDKLDQC